MSQQFGPGVWHLINVGALHPKEGRGEPRKVSLDLSAGDQQTIMIFGTKETDNDNQKWEFQRNDNGTYHIRNVQYGKYITFPDDDNDGKQIIATEGPREWQVTVGHEGVNVKDPEPSIRICHPNTKKTLEVTDHSSQDGALVQLWEESRGKNQAWYFVAA
ncbi:ricin-type beta-trefoil lectin domain protein [Ceratobasidium sp. AG-Ba]|nr:ricin-type beta-trefoil lectin domain protein [Ceratobasidium sp. AG-Ba]QRW15467.1 ricin-type beta-trefoil lectin domain protein [Ceratobasidium sp. AG-Ba]